MIMMVTFLEKASWCVENTLLIDFVVGGLEWTETNDFDKGESVFYFYITIRSFECHQLWILTDTFIFFWF